MIVRQARGELYLVTQPDHAALARRVMERWRPLEDHPRRDVILLAIGEHDNGWREADSAPLVDHTTGGVADFVHVPLDVRQGVWPRGVNRTATTHPWAGALIAHHALYVYQRYRTDPAWSWFFDEMAALEARLVEAGGLTMEALAADYEFLRLGDLVSLAFCAGWTDEQRHAATTMQLAGDRLLVAPDPFGGDTVPLAVPARVLTDHPYASDEDLREACRMAPTIELTGVATGSATPRL